MKILSVFCTLLPLLFLINTVDISAINIQEEKANQIRDIRRMTFAKHTTNGAKNCMQVNDIDNKGKYSTVGYISEADMQRLLTNASQDHKKNFIPLKILKDSCTEITQDHQPDSNQTNSNVKIDKKSITCDDNRTKKVLQMTFGNDPNAYKNISEQEVMYRVREPSLFFTRILTDAPPNQEKTQALLKCVSEYLKNTPSQKQSDKKTSNKPQEPNKNTTQSKSTKNQPPQEKDIGKVVENVNKVFKKPPPIQKIEYADRIKRYKKNVPLPPFIDRIIPGDAPQNPQVKGISKSSKEASILASESGVYTFFKNNVEIQKTEIILTEENEEIVIRFFKDKNNNKEKDNEENFLSIEELDKVTVSKEQEIEIYKLHTGWNSFNFVGLPDSGIKTARDFLESAKAQNLEVIHIAKFDNGKFVIYSLREEESEYAENFSLIPGKGYFIFSYTSGDYSLNYHTFKSSVPIELQNGWNLIGIHSNEKYSSHTLINKLKSRKFNPEIISEFSNGIYNSVIWADPLFYGKEFNIIPKKSYFVKINLQEVQTDENKMIFTP